MTVYHVPTKFMKDPRDPDVRDPYAYGPTPESIGRALRETELERHEALMALPPGEAREQLQRLFDQNPVVPVTNEDLSVREVAELVSRKRFGCPLEVLTAGQRRTIVAYVQEMLEALDASPYQN